MPHNSKIVCVVVALMIARSETSAGDWSSKLSSNELSVKMFYSDLSLLHRARPDSFEIQNTPLPPKTGVNYGRLTFIGGTLLGVMVVTHLYQQSGWWKDNRRPFHFEEDLTYALNYDKVSHLYASSFLTFLFSKSFEWANFSESSALLMGAGGSVLFQTYVELEDGFSTWGFDRVDYAANVVGAVWPLVRYHIPSLQNYDLKFSYLPSKNFNRPGDFPGQRHLFFDDYEGQTNWLSVKVNNLLPKVAEPYWPDFLCVAFGFAGRGFFESEPPYRVYLVGLDFDMTEIIPQNTWFLKTLGEALNFIRFPAPAVRFSPNTIWYGLYF